MTGLRLILLLALAGIGLLMVQPERSRAQARPDTDEQFLDAWQQRCFAFFWERADPHTGLIADRAPADGAAFSKTTIDPVASIASTGFGLTAICIAEQRGWVEHDQAYQRVENTLRFLRDGVENVEGFYYHFVDMKTGQRAWESELSSIDTALLLGGVLTARQHFPNTPVADMALEIYERVNWPWMMDGRSTLSMGWNPDRGAFLPWHWDHFSEHMIMQLLGLGSPTHPLPPQAWHAWRRGPVLTHGDTAFMSYPPLFVHQFSHAWIDFRDKRDDYADYWQNSVLATRAHKQMFQDLSETFPLYGENLWGVTSSDSAEGYMAWGGPDPSPEIDGTVVPCAAAGSIPFEPEACIAAVRNMYDSYGDRIWKRYGLVDAFNPHTGWVAPDVIGIDVGITMLMIENHRTGFVWERFMANPEVQNAMQIAGFRDKGEDPADLALFFDPANPPYALGETPEGDATAQ